MKTKKLRILSALLALAMMLALMPTAAFAEDSTGSNIITYNCGENGDNVVATLDTVTGVMTISGTGAMVDYSEYNQPWYNQKNNIKKLVVEDEVTCIGRSAFYKCTELAEVDMSNAINLITISENAFGGCSGLKTVALPQDGVLETIGWNAFSYFYYDSRDRPASIEKIVIPASVKVIGQYAFDGCASLSEVSFAPGSQLKEIGSEAFQDTNLTEIIIPASVEKIGYDRYDDSVGNVFAGCSQLTKVIFESPSSLENVAQSTFEGCSNATIYCEDNIKDKLSGKGVDTAKILSLDELNAVVTFDVDGEVFAEQNTKDNNFKATEPKTPTKKGYQFTGWYTKDDNDKYELFDFDTTITENITLYAQWEKVPVDTYVVTVENGVAWVEADADTDAVAAGESISVPEGVTVHVKADSEKFDGMVFEYWKDHNGNVTLENDHAAETTFTMPAGAVHLEAMPKMESDDSGWDAATIVTGAVIGTGTAILAYHIGTELYAEQVLGKDVAVPRTRGEVALLAWQLAGQPEPAEATELLTEEAKAQQWAVESGLLKLDAEGNFNAEKKLSKWKALRVLDKAQKLG